MSTTRQLDQTRWRDSQQQWDLRGLAKSMYKWLAQQVPGSNQHRGWELAGTLDPDHPSPEHLQPPPAWLSAEILMQSACAWQAGALQDALMSSGHLPLVRARVNDDGELRPLGGADVVVRAGKIPRTGMPSQCAYYVVVDQEAGPYLLSTKASVQVTPVANLLTQSVAPVYAVAPVTSSMNRWSASFQMPSLDLGAYAGFLYRFEGDVAADAFVHLFA